MLDKLIDLNGRQEVWSGEGNAHDQVKAIAASEPTVEKARPVIVCTCDYNPDSMLDCPRHRVSALADPELAARETAAYILLTGHLPPKKNET